MLVAGLGDQESKTTTCPRLLPAAGSSRVSCPLCSHLPPAAAGNAEGASVSFLPWMALWDLGGPPGSCYPGREAADVWSETDPEKPPSRVRSGVGEPRALR